MPKLLSVQMMDESQRAHPKVVRALEKADTGRLVPEPDLPWRVCLWFTRDGKRPTDSHGWVCLGAGTPRELLLTTVVCPCSPDAGTGLALLGAARLALDTDILDSKRVLLVLCDWLEEHGHPQHALLREFCTLKQRWLPWCLAPGAKLDREALRSGGGEGDYP